jgi:hypothetical protein
MDTNAAMNRYFCIRLLAILAPLLLVAAALAVPPDQTVLLPGQALGSMRPGSVELEDGASALDERGQLLVGKPGGYAAQAGNVSLYRFVGGRWENRQIITAPIEFQQTGARFGHALASHGRWLLVGAPRETVDGVNQAGAAYLFRRRIDNDSYELVGGGRLIQGLVTGNARRLGTAVAIGADFAALGVPGHSALGNSQVGQVVTLARQPNDAWFLTGTINLPAGNPANGAAFGSTLLMDATGANLFIAAPDQTVLDQALAGRVYRYRHNAGAWQLRQQLSWSPTDLLDRFGSAMTLANGRLFIAAPARSKPGSAQTKGGGVRVYRLNAVIDSWVSEADLFPDVPQAGARFGQALSALPGTLGPRLLVGVPRRNLGTVLIGVRSEAGEALVFESLPAGDGYDYVETSALRWAGSILASASGNRLGSSVLLAERDGLPFAAASAPGRSEDGGLTAGWVQTWVGDRIFGNGFQSP